MLSFLKRKSKADKVVEIMPYAVELSARNWKLFSKRMAFKDDVPLRQRISMFHQINEQGLKNNLKSLKDAPEAVTLVIAAKGIIAAGDYSKETIEEALDVKIP